MQPESVHDRFFSAKPFQSNAENCSLDLDDTYASDPSTDSATSLIFASLYRRLSITTPTTDEGSGKIERFVSHSSPSSQAHNAKRKSPYHDHLSAASKRFCAKVDLVSNLGVKEVATNESDVPEHDLDRGSEPGKVQDDPEIDFLPNKATDEVTSTVLGSGKFIEADSSFVDALANIDLTPTAGDHKTSTATERYSRTWVENVPLRNEPRTLPSENSDTFPGNSSLDNPKRKSIVTSSSGNPQSINSKGSLFGRPSTHSYKPWTAWSSGSGTQAGAAKSLHSNCMPAPMLNSVDEELLLSRAWTSEERRKSKSSGYKPSSHLTPHEQFGMAAEDGDIERLRILVEDLAFDCNHRDYEGRTALVWAAERGHYQAVKILLSNLCGGVDVNAQDDHGMTAMMYACHWGDLRVLDSLLSQPAIDLRLQNNAGTTALIIAIQLSDPDNTDIFNRLFAHVQTRPDYHTTAAKWHPIFNVQDNRGMTPLHVAVGLGRHECISALLDTKRVDVDMKAKFPFDGTTPAMYAVERFANPGVLELLFDRKACDPTLVNELGETLVGVAMRVVQETVDMLAKLAHASSDSVTPDRRRSQEARDSLSLCEAYAHHYAGEQDQVIESSVTAGPVL
jgi:ankyrin repeat protein